MALDGQAALRVAFKKNAGEMQKSAVCPGQTDRYAVIIRAAEHEMDRHNAGPQNFPGAIDILEKKLERAQTLGDASDDPGPFRRGKDVRQKIAARSSLSL